jgi:hypothetical protein
MNETRRILLAVLGALSTEALFNAKRMAYAVPAIPIDPPVPSPVPKPITDAETLIISALKDISEDKGLTLSEMMSKVPKLQEIKPPDLELAVKDLVWHKELEQDDQVPPRYSLIRSAGG